MEEHVCLDCRDSDNFPLEQIKDLDAKYFDPIWGPRQWSLISNVNRTLACFWKSQSGQVKSFIFGEVNFSESSFEIYKLVTIPEARRKNLASQLFRSLCNYCNNNGIRKILLQVGAHNIPAIKTYDSWGFHSLRSLKNYYGCGKDAVELIFQLDPS